MSPTLALVRSTRIGLLTLFGLLALATAAPAADSNAAASIPRTTAYSLHEWHEAAGLPHEEIARVLQDQRGFLWVATTDGLARFDSVHFDNFADSLKAAGASPSIRAIAEAAGLGLVCAPENGGLLVADAGQWRRLPLAEQTSINSLFTDSVGALWASCDDRVLRRFANGQAEFFPVAPLGSNRPDAYFAQDEKGAVWIATGSFLGRYEEGRLVRHTTGLSSAEFRLASSHRGGPWVATRDRLHKLTDGRADAGVPLPPLVGAHYIRTLFEDRRGVLWIGTRSQGLFVLNQGALSSVPLRSEDVRSICEDSEGNVWVGTNGGGLARLRLRDFQLFDQSSGLRDNFSYTVCEDQEGTMWFGNRDGCVARYKDGAIDPLAQRLGWKQFNAMSVLPDLSGLLWVTSGIGIFKIDPLREQLIRLPELQSIKLVRVTHVARNGDYWLSLDPNRVGRFRDGTLETFGPEQGLIGQEIRCFAEESSGALWVGTADGKVFRFDGTRFARVPLGSGENLGAVQALLFETDDIVWIGMNRPGLGVLAGGNFRAFDRRHGLPDDRITDIIRDDAGRFWFGSNSGVFSIQHEALRQLRENKIDRVQAILAARDDTTSGLSCLGMFKPSTWKDRTGRLWFTTRKGVLMFDPASVNTEVLCPPVFLSAVKLDGRRLASMDALTLGTQVRKTELRLSVLRFTAPDHVQIRYRLIGFDNDWVDAGPDRVAVYPGLPAGDYRFEAQSSLSNGVWNENGVSLRINVVPVWWQSRGVLLLAALLAVGVIALIVRAWSHRRLHQRVERLERESAIERERTRIARDIHDDLGANLARISLLTQPARQDAETTSAARLAQIYDAASEITRSMNEIVWAVNPRHDQLDSLADYLVSFAQGLLSAADIRCRLDVPPQLPSTQLSSHVRHTLYLCVKEIMHNTVRHSGATEFRLAIHAAPEELRIVLRDNGRGFDPTAPRPADPARPGGGNGLENIRRRMAEISGSCSIVSQHGAGTEITLSLPLQTAHDARS